MEDWKTHEEEVAVVRSVLKQYEADAALLSFLPDIRWATGFTGSNALLHVSAERTHFLSDGRYKTQAAKEVSGPTIHIPEGPLLDYAHACRLFQSCPRTLLQAEHVTLSQLKELSDRFPEVAWTPVEGMLKEYVARKTPREIAAVQRALAITEDVFEHLLHFIEPGMTETEIAAEIVYQHLRRGAEAMSFDPIVASGSNSALPHARPTDRALRDGDVLLLDFGCFLGGYASDMTRTIAIGEPGEKARMVYRSVLAAQETAISSARGEMPANELDACARDSIAADGYADYFLHSLGHGVGLQIHEWPRVASTSKDVLPTGALITIEPGIYIEGAFGVRIEDMIVLEDDGCKNLTRARKELIVL